VELKLQIFLIVRFWNTRPKDESKRVSVRSLCHTQLCSALLYIYIYIIIRYTTFITYIYYIYIYICNKTSISKHVYIGIRSCLKVNCVTFKCLSLKLQACRRYGIWSCISVHNSYRYNFGLIQIFQMFVYPELLFPVTMLGTAYSVESCLI
jgi:hypothetical protein